MMINSKVLLIIVGLSGAIVVALGAYGAHALKGVLESGLMVTFQKGLTYQSTHTLALLGIASLLMHNPQSRWLKISAAAFVSGIILFSGSLYMIVLLGIKSVGIVTPLGGVAFIVGWLSLSWVAHKGLPFVCE